MNKAALILGSNISDGRNYLLEAHPLIENKLGKIIQKSSVYCSPPWGYQSYNEYRNQVIVIETLLNPLSLLNGLLSIETSLGRIRNISALTYEDRTLDIDILLIDDLIVNDIQLEVPHPRMHLRKFCLAPLAEIMPHWIVPTFSKTIEELLVECEDESELRLED
jgi:2-amino-4-hydroxy-6-hydroxymethyldihydropteridine diphosphokinase